MLKQIMLTKPKASKLTEILFSNYNFSANQLVGAGWTIGGGTTLTDEGINNTKCAKLPTDYSGLYRDFTILPNTAYKFDVLVKTTTTTNLQVLLRNTSTNADIYIKLLPDTTNYVSYSIDFMVNLNSIRLGFEVYPGSGQMFVNEVRLFKYN